MKKLICKFKGHENINIKLVDTLARPGGMLPSLDGYNVYKPTATRGTHLGCMRCGRVIKKED